MQAQARRDRVRAIIRIIKANLDSDEPLEVVCVNETQAKYFARKSLPIGRAWSVRKEERCFVLRIEPAPISEAAVN